MITKAHSKIHILNQWKYLHELLAIAYGAKYQPDEYDDDFFTNFIRKEEPRERKIVFRCTKSELESIERYANIIEVKFTEEEIHHG